MILKLAKQNGLEAIVFTIVIFVAMAISMFIGPSQFITVPQNGTPLFNTIYQYFFDGKISVVCQITSLLLLSFEILMINLLNSDFEISRAKPTMFALVYMVISLSFIPNNTLLPEQIANIFIIFGLIKILSIHRINDASYTVFDSGLFFGIALMFCLSALTMLPIGIVALIIFRRFKWREYTIFILGFFTPIIFYIAGYYLAEGTIQPLKDYWIAKFSVSERPTITYNQIIDIGVKFLLIFIASVMILGEYQKYNLFSSRAYQLMFVMFLLIFGATVLPYFGMQTLKMLTTPLTFLFVTLFHDSKQKIWSEIFFAMFLVGFIAIQYLWYRL